MTKNRQTTFWKNKEDERLIKELKSQFGLRFQSDVIRLALRKLKESINGESISGK